jgi:hypothetical protein
MSLAEVVCPQCRAQLDLGLLRETQAAVCPFCQGPVSAVLSWSPGEGSVRERAAAVTEAPRDRLDDPPPPESRVRVLQSGVDQLVLLIPPGGQSLRRLLGWAIFTTTLLPGWVWWGGVAFREGHIGLAQFLIFEGLLCLPVAFLWWCVLRLRFERALVSLDRERAVLQKTLFGWTQREEIPVDSTTRVELESEFSPEDQPIHRIEISSVGSSPGKTLNFGTSLSLAEKEWILDRIEPVLQEARGAKLSADHEAPSTVSLSADGHGLADPGSRDGAAPTPRAEPVSPPELSSQTVIRVRANDLDVLRLSFPYYGGVTLGQKVLPAVFGVGVWLWLSGQGAIAWKAWNQGPPFDWLTLLGLPSVLAIPVISILLGAFGSHNLRLTRNLLEVSSGLGPFRLRRNMTLEKPETIVLAGVPATRPQGFLRRRHMPRQAVGGGCSVVGDGRVLAVTRNDDPLLSRQVAGLLLWKLRAWGHSVDSQVAAPYSLWPPRHQARLDDDLLRDKGAHTSPFFNAEVSAELKTGMSFETGTGSERIESVRRDPPAVEVRLVRPLPPGSRLRVVQSDDGQLVLSIPTGGRIANGACGFAFLLSSVPAVFTVMFVMELADRPMIPLWSLAGVLAFVGVLWLVILGVSREALKLQFQRTTLLVDRERVLLQTTIFGKTRQEELPVLAMTKCSLVVAFTFNDVPVYRVQVANAEESLGFATNLEQDDKDWLVDQIEMVLEDLSVVESTATATPGLRNLHAGFAADGSCA